MNRSIRALLAGGGLVVGLAACATATEAAKALSSDAASEPSTTTDARGDQVDGSAEEPGVEATSSSFEVGESAEVGDWIVTVTKVTPLTTPQVKAWHSSNGRAQGQYVMAHYTAEYVGSEHTPDVTSGLLWKFIDSDGQAHDTATVKISADATDAPSDAASAGKVERQVVFDVPVTAVEGGVVIVEGYDEHFNILFAEFVF